MDEPALIVAGDGSDGGRRSLTDVAGDLAELRMRFEVAGSSSSFAYEQRLASYAGQTVRVDPTDGSYSVKTRVVNDGVDELRVEPLAPTEAELAGRDSGPTGTFELVRRVLRDQDTDGLRSAGDAQLDTVSAIPDLTERQALLLDAASKLVGDLDAEGTDTALALLNEGLRGSGVVFGRMNADADAERVTVPVLKYSPPPDRTGERALDFAERGLRSLASASEASKATSDTDFTRDAIYDEAPPGGNRYARLQLQPAGGRDNVIDHYQELPLRPEEQDADADREADPDADPVDPEIVAP